MMRMRTIKRMIKRMRMTKRMIKMTITRMIKKKTKTIISKTLWIPAGRPWLSLWVPG